ncbi:hypothetical protein MPH_03060 [Macrophomina phaseolina MS6]|uniref:Protein kinase domain-containing protein n=1 Tax=Macrophomina phaseolina (strain MS6) TaxID=1126212 RepID=K2SB89_MACPH|nr:hypothetical protein MPH_03060 [Macrophomina phaseolina MS6]
MENQKPGITADEISGLVPSPTPEPPPVVASEDASEDLSEHLEMSASDSEGYDDFTDFTDSGSDDMADRNQRLLNAQEYRKASASLQKELWMRRVENPRGQHTFYIPRNEKRALITRDTIIRQIQLRKPKLSPGVVAEYADAVETTALNLFATLASIGKGGDIVAFLNEGICDGHMPFQRSEGFMFDLRGRDGKEIKSIRRWGHVEREAFDRQQWWMLAPFFSLGQHHDLRDNEVLPFVPSLQQQEEDRHQSTGAYSEVSTVRIHDKHHDFWGACVSNGRGLQVAVKKLKENGEREFEKESTVLKILGNKRHNHLVKLLASYKYKGHYHLIFPRANSNLRTYWETHSQPPFDRATILWTLRQMKGIASGLNTVHNFKVTIPLSVDGNLRMTKENQMLSVEYGEEQYGRHGDIKPENILWFERTLHSNDGMGALQIADFGLGRFHGRESRTKPPGYHIFSSPTYEPPECHVHLRVSRAYDIWSLGCLYLEFITWLLLGTDAIEEFSKERSENSFILHQEGKIQDDYFWTLWFDGNMRRARPRRGVEKWVKKLQEHKNCTMVVRDLLDLITTGLLRIEPENRLTSIQMYDGLKQILRRAENDHQYMCKRTF